MKPAGYAPDWPDIPGVRAWQTTREGGVSEGPYASLNLGIHVDDRAAHVRENRRRLVAGLGLPAEPVWLEQVHGTHIRRIDAGPRIDDDRGPADGAVTRRAGVVLAVMTADCLPVLLAARDGSEVGVAHAGWRGLAGGVLAAAVAAFERPPDALQAWLGPAISQSAFEVGDEVRVAFAGFGPAGAAAFKPGRIGRWQADLYALARLALEAAGVSAVFGDVACTLGNPTRFFSHRREAPCGRLATLIWRESEARR